MFLHAKTSHVSFSWRAELPLDSPQLQVGNMQSYIDCNAISGMMLCPLLTASSSGLSFKVYLIKIMWLPGKVSQLEMPPVLSM